MTPMSQVAALLLSAALLGVAAAGFSPAQSEAAHQGVVESLEAVAAGAAAALGKDEAVELPPYIAHTQRKVAFVTVTTAKTGTNITLHRLGSLRVHYPPGVDPAVEGQDVNFTLPLVLDSLFITGDLTHKVNDVGPTGHFNTTIAQVQLEADGSVRVGGTDVCKVTVSGVRDTLIGAVDTSVEGANVLNPVLAKEVSDAVRGDLIGWKQVALPAVLAALQKEAEKQACAANVRTRLAKLPATAA